MTTKAELLGLAERVEQGDYGSPLIKALYDCLGGGSASLHALDSRDAVEALRKRLLPESFIGVETVLYAPVTYRAWVRMTEHANSQIGLGRAPTEPRARLAALLRAYSETVEG